MPFHRSAFVLAIFIAGVTPGLAQVAGFDPNDYGKAQLPARQSTGDAADYIAANKGAFEPIAELDAADPLAQRAKPVGRLDVVLRKRDGGEEMGTSCTATLLPGNRIITNHHCLPAEGEFEPVKASILMDYLTLDGKQSKRFEIEPKALEASATLDYAIAQIKDDANATFGAVAFETDPATPGESLLVIHHPLGRPKMMSRFRCLALKEQPEGTDFRHRCDTLGGSSGSLLFDANGKIVALHKEGGLDPKDATSFNSATLISAILAQSAILQSIAKQGGTGAPVDASKGNEQPANKTTDSDGSLTSEQMNDILKGN
jgi:V8-like Glu-specific endopeptidase